MGPAITNAYYSPQQNRIGITLKEFKKFRIKYILPEEGSRSCLLLNAINNSTSFPLKKTLKSKLVRGMACFG